MAGFSDERVRAMMLGPRVFGVYPFPLASGHDVGEDAEPLRVAVRVLTETEFDQVRAAAQVDLREYAKVRGWEPASMVDIDPDLFDRCIERQLIFRSFYDPETIDGPDPARFFQKPAEVKELTSTVTSKLAELYLEHQRWVSPVPMTDQEGVDQLIDALGKSERPEAFLGSFARGTLVRCVISMASRLRGTT